jgi:hypothetical protein
VWVSGPKPGVVHDLAQRGYGHLMGAGRSGMIVLADKGHACADKHIRTRNWDKLASQKNANRARARGERANTQLKSWRILRKLRCCPWRVA